jgi:5-methylcytosine-specific restriction endonuclease McrA
VSTTNFVFVLDDARRPLSPCSPARARQLLREGKAAVFRRYPFTIILKREITGAKPMPVTVKIDPGSKTTGLAVVQGCQRLPAKVIWGGELEHRGRKIRDALVARRARRRNRRNRLRYRKPRFRTRGQINNAEATYERRRAAGWLPPSLMHRVETILTWINRLRRYAPVGRIAMELVRFDMQAMQRPGIAGVEYQQGELAGYEIREYLLEKWGRACAYCGAEHVPLEIDHIQPRSKGGSSRVSNLTLACHRCNQRKGNLSVAEFLADKPEILKRILARAKIPLADAAAVNATRWRLHSELKALGLPVETASGGRTKWNRSRLGWEKTHWLDAAAVGDIGTDVGGDIGSDTGTLCLATRTPLVIVARGQGGRQKGVMDRYGQPRRNKRGEAQVRPLKPIHGWRSGDIATVGDKAGAKVGDKAGGVVGRITPRTKGPFAIRVAGHPPRSLPISHLKRIHRNDGYDYPMRKV